MRLITVLTSTIVLGLLLVGCENKTTSEAEKQFAAKVAVADMNKSLNMKLIGEQEYYLPGSQIDLILENRTSDTISFNEGEQIKLLANIDSQWIEIANDHTYSGTMLLYPPQSQQGLNFGSTTVKPNLEQNIPDNEDSLIPLRVVVIGEIKNADNTVERKVGAFVDVLIKPNRSLTKTTEPIIYLTESNISNSGGKIEGTIISFADEQPLSDVLVDLVLHPFFNQGDSGRAIATTKTDAQGRFLFENVEPGVYALQTTNFMRSGGSCGDYDLSKIIKIEVGMIAEVNLSLKCGR